MSCRDRLHDFAVSGALIGALIFSVEGWSQQPDGPNNSAINSDQQKPAAQQTEPPKDDPPGSIFWKDKRGSAETYQSICEAPKNQSDADLCQQWRSAEAAQRSASYAFWQAIASMIGIFGLIASTFFSGWAAIAASKAAHIAAEAVASERAWMCHFGFDTGTAENSTINGEMIQNGVLILPNWQNMGRSPALNCGITNQWKLIELDESIPIFNIPKGDNGASAPCGPGVKVKGSMIFLNDEQSELFRQRRGRLIVYSKVFYSDTFHPAKLRSSEICFEALYRGNGPMGKDGVIPLAIDFMAVGSQNSAF